MGVRDSGISRTRGTDMSADQEHGSSSARTPRTIGLRVRRLGIDTQQEAAVFMHRDCPVCRSEGFRANARVLLRHGSSSIIATLYHVKDHWLGMGEAGLSESAWARLGVRQGDEITAHHPRPLESLSKVRGKVYGKRLEEDDFQEIIVDIVAGRYSDVHLSSFITACSARPLDRDEIVDLTRAMVDAGERLEWGSSPIVDKHSVGGLPGNRTTPIVVAIVAACGLTMPKTSSRAITSPSGTADTMETMAPVDLDTEAMRRVVAKEGGCIIWGGSVELSPADDILIRVERALDIDSDAQLVASVLSKKIAAGSTHLVLDLPMGPTAKIRSESAARSLAALLADVASVFGLQTKMLVSDGSQPVGRGIGPALEARDVLAVLQNAPDAPVDLRTRAVRLAGVLLELASAAANNEGEKIASSVLADGRAWRKFQRICEAQGGMREPPTSMFRHPVLADRSGAVALIDNRRLAMVAKLAGAPESKAAGVYVHQHVGERVSKGDPLFTIHAQTRGELAYAVEYVAGNSEIFQVRDS